MVCRPILLAAFVLMPFVAACSTGGSSGASTGTSQNIITLAEIQGADAQTAFEIVQQLRPRWTIRNRGSRSFETGQADDPRVILDDLPPREFDFLREIDRAIIQEIRFLEPREATFLYGTGYNAGVIRVISKR